MNEQLVAAIKERVAGGVDKETIKRDVMAVGHDETTFEAAYVAAQEQGTETDVPPVPGVPSADAGGSYQAEAAGEEMASDGTLISVGDLVDQAVRMPFDYLRLVGGAVVAAAALLVLLGGVGFLAVGALGTGPSAGAFGFVVATISYFISTIGFGLIGWTITTGFLRRHTDPGFWSNFSWLIGHVVAASILILLVQLATTGAALALIIPGIILTFYIAFTFHVFVVEERRGFDAILRSIHLVHNHWWGVVGRSFALALLVVLAGMVAGLMVVLIPLAGMIMLPLVWVWAVFTMSAGSVLLFESLRAMKAPATYDPQQYSGVKVAIYIACALGVFVLLVQLWGATESLEDSLYMPQDLMEMPGGSQYRGGGMQQFSI